MRRQFFSTTVSFNCVCPHVNAFDNFTAVTNEDLCLWDIQFHGYNRLHFLSIMKWVILRSFILVKFGKKSHFKFQATGFEGLWISVTVLWAFKKPHCLPKVMSDRVALLALFSSLFLCYVIFVSSGNFSVFSYSIDGVPVFFPLVNVIQMGWYRVRLCKKRKV